jgi:hypothetical protein
MGQIATIASVTCAANNYPLNIILYLRDCGETRGIDLFKTRERRMDMKGGSAMNPMLLLSIASVLVEAALTALKLMKKQK